MARDSGDEVVPPQVRKANIPAPILDVPAICSDITKQSGAEASEVVDADYAAMEDDDVLASLLRGELKDHQLEKKLGDYERAVRIRRGLYEQYLQKPLDLIPYEHFDYKKVFGANCEIVLGYVPIPLGIVGPLVINGEPVYIPMATTEGCLVASTNRGCKAISAGGGCCSVVMKG
jgi:hydroxymethylglutaryl-CoA reductase (NADPH)